MPSYHSFNTMTAGWLCRRWYTKHKHTLMHMYVAHMRCFGTTGQGCPGKKRDRGNQRQSAGWSWITSNAGQAQQVGGGCTPDATPTCSTSHQGTYRSRFSPARTSSAESHLPLRLERLQSSGIEVSAHRQPGPGALFVTCLLTPLYICSARNATLCAGS